MFLRNSKPSGNFAARITFATLEQHVLLQEGKEVKRALKIKFQGVICLGRNGQEI